MTAYTPHSDFLRLVEAMTACVVDGSCTHRTWGGVYADEWRDGSLFAKDNVRIKCLRINGGWLMRGYFDDARPPEAVAFEITVCNPEIAAWLGWPMDAAISRALDNLFAIVKGQRELALKLGIRRALDALDHIDNPAPSA